MTKLEIYLDEIHFVILHVKTAGLEIPKIFSSFLNGYEYIYILN